MLEAFWRVQTLQSQALAPVKKSSPPYYYLPYLVEPEGFVAYVRADEADGFPHRVKVR